MYISDADFGKPIQGVFVYIIHKIVQLCVRYFSKNMNSDSTDLIKGSKNQKIIK